MSLKRRILKLEAVRKKKTSDAQLRANDKYNKKNTTTYTVRMNNQLYSILEKAFSENKEYNNKMGYTIQAIKEKLIKDGYLNEDGTPVE